MPAWAWLLFFTGPALILVLRLATWLMRALGYQRDPRPGYLDLTRRP